jgi:serine/threonine-protein kinase
VLGTAAYLSPEQARGEAAGPSSDLYALGVVAYQLLAGRLPYEAASLTDLARQQGTPPPRLDELDAEVPRALASVVAKALNADPERRYPDAAAMETALREGLQGRGPENDTDTTWALPQDDTAATQMLSGTSTTRAMSRERPQRRRMEPIAEPAAPPRTAPPRRREPARRARTAPPAGRGGGMRLWLTLLAVLAVIAAGIVAYQALQDTGRQAVELKENVEGRVQDAINDLRDLVEDNTQ